MTLPVNKLLLDPLTGSTGALTNGASGASGIIDTLGVGWVSIDVTATTQSASTQAGSPSTLKLQGSDTTVASTFADIVGFRGGSALATNVDFMVPIGKTSGANAYRFNVNAEVQPRYLQVVAVPTTTQTFYVSAHAFRNKVAPSSAVSAGVLSLVEG
jgi:hypothetical protein